MLPLDVSLQAAAGLLVEEVPPQDLEYCCVVSLLAGLESMYSQLSIPDECACSLICDVDDRQVFGLVTKLEYCRARYGRAQGPASRGADLASNAICA